MSVDVAEPSGGGVTVLRLKKATTPAGKLEIERLTPELKPLREVTARVDVLESPWATTKADGEAAIEKSLEIVRMSVTVVLWVKASLAPVMVRA
jgi:hypothetical protein